MEKSEMKKELLVVGKLPQQDLHKIVNEEQNTEYELVTIEEALTELLSSVREILKNMK
jgi:hypothetical protein